MLSKRNRRNKKHSKKRTRIYRGGVRSLLDSRVSNNFHSKLKTLADGYGESLKNDGIVTKLVPQYNCNFDITFSSGLYNNSKIAYTVFMKQFMGTPSAIRTEILKFNPFDELLTGEQEKIDYISRIFDIVSDKNYIYILYLVLYRHDKENITNKKNQKNQEEDEESETFDLKSYLERNHFKELVPNEKQAKIDSIIQTIQEYDNKVTALKETGTIDGASLEEIDVFKIIMVALQFFNQTLREFGNISISINGEDKLDKNTSEIEVLYQEKSYLLFEEIITNILKLLTQNLNSSVCTFILFLFFPSSTDIIGTFLIVSLPQSIVLVKNDNDPFEQPGAMGIINNFPGDFNPENKYFVQGLLDNPTSSQSRYVNNIFSKVSTISNKTLLEYIKKGFYINIIINAGQFYMETTDVWILKYKDLINDQQIILGFVIITSIYDFKKLTYKNINQIRWYINQNVITKEKFNELTKNYYDLPDCIKYDISAPVNIIAQDQQETELQPGEEPELDPEQAKTSINNIVLGSIGAAVVATGAVVGTLFGVGVLGGKSKRKRKTRKSRRKNRKITRIKR
jgi:hypothetical protein